MYVNLWVQKRGLRECEISNGLFMQLQVFDLSLFDAGWANHFSVFQEPEKYVLWPWEVLIVAWLCQSGDQSSLLDPNFTEKEALAQVLSRKFLKIS